MKVAPKRISAQTWYQHLASKWRALKNPPVFDSTNPHLPFEERRRFFAELAHSKVFLEYGSGGSTLAALTNCAPSTIVVSVENDRRFAKALLRGARQIAGAQFFPIFVDVGKTAAWGEPVKRAKTPVQLSRWSNYAKAPWRFLNHKGVVPDFIFIDGRFRVACTLESMLNLPSGSECRFLFDDFYQYDDAYSATLRFAESIETVGRALMFRKSPDFDPHECRKLLYEYYKDFR